MDDFKPLQPDGLGGPKLTVANAETDKALSPTGKAVLTVPPWVGLIGGALVAAAGVVLAFPTMGISLPPAVMGAAAIILGVGGALGLNSAGARKPSQ